MPKEFHYGVQSTPSLRPVVVVRWGREDENVVVAAQQDVNAATPGVELDRRATNQLIRTLRRARDAAFGPDA